MCEYEKGREGDWDINRKAATTETEMRKWKNCEKEEEESKRGKCESLLFEK